MSRLFLLALTAAIVFSSGGAQAELGGNVTSVQSDQIRMKATLQARVANVATPYSVHTLSTEIGVIIHEYADAAGTVFAVTWSGPTKPNLRQLLGRYFEPFISASASTKKPGTGPITINQTDLVVFSGGHPRAFFGSAHVPALVPAGVDIHALH